MKRQGTKFSQWLLCIIVFLILFPIFFFPYFSSAARRSPYTIDALDHDFPYLNCSMRVIDADVRDVLLAFANKYELNIIMSEEVKGAISIIINNIPVKEAFKNILQYSDLGYIKEKNVYRIKPIEILLKEKKLHNKTADLTTEIIFLKHANAQRLAPKFLKFKSDLPEALIDADKWTNSLIIKDTPKKIEEIKKIIRQLDIPTQAGEKEFSKESSKIIKLHYINCQDVAKIQTLREKISTHPQTNSVIITDIIENIPQLAAIIQGLDKPIRQILIEAKIVETNKSFSNFFGIQWGGHYSAGPPSGKNFPSVSIGGALGGSDNYAVNLPVPSDPYGSLNFVVGHLKDKGALNVRLSAMEDSGNGRIISQPRIMTLDNTKATISSGETIQLPASSSETNITTGDAKQEEGTSEIEAKTELVVTPHIILDDQIKLKLDIKRDTPDFTRTINNVPVIITREANTELIISDGETAVIGGLAITGTTTQNKSIPLLSRIPVLGWLFKSKAKTSEYGELLVFITPHIIQPPDYAQSEEKRR